MDEKNPAKIDSKFRFVLVAAERAEQLMRGARPKVEAPKRKPTSLAMDEVHHELVEWDYGPAPRPEEPPAAEAEPSEETPVEVH